MLSKTGSLNTSSPTSEYFWLRKLAELKNCCHVLTQFFVTVYHILVGSVSLSLILFDLDLDL